MKIPRIALLLLPALLLLGCSMSKDAEIAETKVPEFHSLLDSGQFSEIYLASADELKKVSKEADFVALLDAVHRKLGKKKSSERQTWNVNYNTSGIFVTLTYKTVYSEGDASEQFVYRLQDGDAKLAGYHVNSNVLIIK